MSENTNAVTPTRSVVDGVIIDLASFGDKGKYKGFSFFEKSFKDLDSANRHFTALGENADELLTGLINKALSSMARSKAVSKLPADDEAVEAHRNKGGEMTVISADEAMRYVPGERDAWSIAGLNKKLNEVRVSIKEARAAGASDTDDIILNLKADGKELVEKIRVAQEKLNNEFE
jgi:hypothetical protein